MRILLTGASGFLGRAVAAALARRHLVTGLYLKESSPIPGCALRRADIQDPAALLGLARELAPELVIHAAAMANPELCEQQPLEAHRVNVAATGCVLQACRSARAKLIYLSTDLVFDGKSPPYTEASVPHPLNLYARGKREAELLVMGGCEGALVLRMALGYGWKVAGPPAFTDRLYRALARGEKVKLFTDQYRSPLYLGDAARMLCGLAELAGDGRLPPGVLHMAGPERLSRLAFGEAFCRAFGFSRDLIVPVRMSEVPALAARPADCTLDGSRLAALLAYGPRPVEDALSEMRACAPALD